MGQTFGTLPTGQRQVLSEAPVAAPALPFDQAAQPGLGGVAAAEKLRKQALIQQLLMGRSNIQAQPVGLMDGPPTLESVLMQREMGGQ